MNLFILYRFQWHCTIVNNQAVLLFPPMVYREKLTSHHIHHHETFNSVNFTICVLLTSQLH